MSRTYTPEEVEQRYVEAMGPELGRMFNRLYNECVWLHIKWREYVALFGTRESRIDLLNIAAPGFFRLIDESLWEDVLLHIFRFTDPNKKTLTLQRLPALVEAEIQPEITKHLEVVLDKSKFAKDWRHRHIAHRELRLALEQGAKPLAEASRQRVQDAVNAIAELLNVIECHYCNNAPVGYDFASHWGNAEELLYLIRDGLEARADRRRRFEVGQSLLEDHRPKSSV